MNAGTEPKDVAKECQLRNRSKSRVRWRGWLLLLVLTGAALWFVLAGRETPNSRTESEVRRILSSVRQNDRSAFNLYAVLDAMRQWPQPFPRLARAVLGPDSVPDDPARRMAALGPFVVPVLTNALATDRNAAVRAIAATALGQTHDLRLAPGLLASFSTEHEARVQSPILEPLGELGAAQAEPLLITVLMGTNDPQVRVSAARALGQFATPAALSALTNALLTAGDSSLRQWIVMSSLQSVSDPMVTPALLTVLRSDTNDFLRRSSAQALKDHPGEDTAAALVLSLREDSDTRNVRPAAIEALREMTNSVIQPALLEALH